MNYEEKAIEIINAFLKNKKTWVDGGLAESIELALKQAYAEGFMDCMNKMMAYVKIETEKEEGN